MKTNRILNGVRYHAIEGTNEPGTCLFPGPYVGWRNQDGSDLEEILLPANADTATRSIYLRECWNRLKRRVLEGKPL